MGETGDVNRPTLLSRVSVGARAAVQAAHHAWLLLAFAIPFLIFFYLKSTLPPAISGGIIHNWGGLPLSDIAMKWWAIFSSVLFFGALGSTVSIYSRQNPGPEEEARNRTLIGAQVLGAIFATLLFLSFLGGLVQGSIFPTIYVGTWYDIGFTQDSWARLMVWSFVAGFSERFVPDLLNNLAMRSSSERDEK